MADDQVPLGECPMPHEWTDEEYLRLMREMSPTDDVSVAMRMVWKWRQEQHDPRPG